MVLACLGVVCWHEIVDETGDSVLGTITAIGQAMGQFVILMTAVTIFIVEGSPMLVEHFLKRRHEEGRLQGRKEQYQELREYLDALKSELERQGVEVELPAPPPPPPP